MILNDTWYGEISHLEGTTYEDVAVELKVHLVCLVLRSAHP